MMMMLFMESLQAAGQSNLFSQNSRSIDSIVCRLYESLSRDAIHPSDEMVRQKTILFDLMWVIYKIWRTLLA